MKKKMFLIIALLTPLLGSAVMAATVWQTGTDMAIARDQFAACATDEYVFIFGGNGNPDGVNLNNGEKYNIATNTWEPIAANPHIAPGWGVEELCGVNIDGRFFIFGAWDGDGTANFNEMYDPATDTWTTLANKPSPVSSAVPAVYNNKIYLFGGDYESNAMEDGVNVTAVDAYDPAANTWENVSTMPITLEGMAIAVYGDNAYLIGGYNSDAQALNTEIMTYNFTTNTWTRNVATMKEKDVRIYPYCQTPVIGSKACLIGGGKLKSNQHIQTIDDVVLFDLVNFTTEEADSIPEARFSHAVAANSDMIFVVGGYLQDNDNRAEPNIYMARPDTLNSISEHISKIEISTSYDYGFPGDDLEYEFDASIQVDETVASGTVQVPDGTIYPLTLDDNDSETWLSYSIESSNPDDISDMLFGTFTFTVTYNDGSSDSTSVLYAAENGDPLTPVTQQPQLTNPAHMSENISTQLTFEFDPASNTNDIIEISWEPVTDDQDSLEGQTEELPYDSSSYGPVTLSPSTAYEVEMTINNVRRFTIDAGIPVVMDMDAESKILFTTQIHAPAIGLELEGKKLPETVIAGNGDKLSLTAIVENVGQLPYGKDAAVDINFYARNIDTDELTIISQLENKSIKNLKPGKTKKYKTTAYIPAELAPGQYTLQAAIGETFASVPDYTLQVQLGYLGFTLTELKSSIPDAIVAGQVAKTAVQIGITNTGNITTEKTFMPEISIIARPAGGGDDQTILTTQTKLGNLKPDKTKKISLKPQIPADIPGDTYDIIFQLNVNGVIHDLNLGTIVISDAFVDLTCTVDCSSAPQMIIPGSKTKLKIPIEISNNGNVPLDKSETVDIELYLRNENGNQNDILISTTENYKIGGLKTGKPKKLSLSIQIPATVPSGSYRCVAVVDSGNDVNESNEANNAATSDDIIEVAGNFLEMTKFNDSSNQNYNSTAKGSLYGESFSGNVTINVANQNGNITETVTSNDGWDTQQQTYRWSQNDNGIYLESFGQEIDMGMINFDFNNLLVFAADGNTRNQSSLSGQLIVEYGWKKYTANINGTATASGTTTGIKSIKVNGNKYDAVESKISLSIDSTGNLSVSGQTVQINLKVKQAITYWTTSAGIIKSQIKTSVKVSIPGYGSESGSGTEIRELVF